MGNIIILRGPPHGPWNIADNPSSTPWLAAIRENPKRVPILHEYLKAYDHPVSLEEEKANWDKGDIPFERLGKAAAIAAGVASIGLPMTRGKMDRRKFFKVLGLGAAAVTSGRLADSLSTKAALDRTALFIQRVQENEYFQTLPPGVQQIVSPSISDAEANPYARENIEEVRRPAVAIGRAVQQGAALTAGVGIGAIGVRAAQELVRKTRGKITKREPKERNESCFTPSVVLTEVGALALKRGKDASHQFEVIKSNSVLVPISAQIARQAAEEKVRHQLYALDAVIYACAQVTGSTLLTEDRKLLPLKGVRSLRTL